MIDLWMGKCNASLVRLRTWIAANTWTPGVQPKILRHPLYCYGLAAATVASAACVTWGLEHALSGVRFHWGVGFFAVLSVAIVWGSGPALIGAVLNAILLDSFVGPPRLASPTSTAAHLTDLFLALVLGIAVSLVAGQAEARRRELVHERAELTAERNRLRQALAVLTDLERERDRLLATISHDLRNPLTAVSGMTYVLQQRAEQLEGTQRDRLTRGLKTIETAARRMTVQITELLDFSQRKEERAQELDLAATDIVALARGVLLERQSLTHVHTLRLDTEAELMVMQIDASRVARALANLVDNAIKYSPHGGLIVVSLARAAGPSGSWLQIDIADQGLGIPSHDLPHVFEQYFRASNVRNTITGTGIGLASVRHMILLHGGTVTLDSTEGAGTTVHIRLPLEPARVVEQAGAGERLEAAS